MRYVCLFLLITSRLAAQTVSRVVQNDNGTHTFEVDGKPFIALAAQLWNSSDWPYILDKEWPQLKELHCNTLEAPVYWQNIEPEPGKFRFDELDSLLEGARRNDLRLVLLWFGSFKNGSSQYAPEWVLSNPAAYPRMRNAAGEEIQVLSTVSAANRAADKNAFAALMRRLKETDGRQHTVILVQVENESGSLGTDRDYSPAANALFHQPVPADLVQQHGHPAGTWDEVFGTQAAETFSAYELASYVEEVAAAGRSQYDVTMYTNAWQREYRFRRPGADFPSGGPVSTMIPIWKRMAPSLAFLSPDLYEPSAYVFEDFCRQYAIRGNAFYLPEMGKGIEYAREQFYALGRFDAMGVGTYGVDPFGVDPTDQRVKDHLDLKFASIADNYRLLRGVTGEIATLQATGALRAVGEEPGVREQLLTLGDYDILCSFGFPTYRTVSGTGRALVGQLGPDEFLVAGFDTRFEFRPRYGSGFASAEYLVIEEGYYDNQGAWVRKRIWNGDEAYHSTLTPDGAILRIRLRRVAKAYSGPAKQNFE
jgi:hypothetical protein